MVFNEEEVVDFSDYHKKSENLSQNPKEPKYSKKYGRLFWLLFILLIMVFFLFLFRAKFSKQKNIGYHLGKGYGGQELPDNYR